MVFSFCLSPWRTGWLQTAGCQWSWIAVGRPCGSGAIKQERYSEVLGLGERLARMAIVCRQSNPPICSWLLWNVAMVEPIMKQGQSSGLHSFTIDNRNTFVGGGSCRIEHIGFFAISAFKEMQMVEIEPMGKAELLRN